GTMSIANGINSSGQVVGYGVSATAGYYRAFIWQDGVMTELGTLGGCCSYGRGINAAGQVVGESTTRDGESHGFLWDKGVMTDLGVIGFGFAKAINARGAIVGSRSTGLNDPYKLATLWTVK